ncbi:MAG: hypothetical protein AAF662_03105 [Pseudomonadota bacterium]
MQRTALKFPFPARCFMAVGMLLTGCTGTGITEWTDHARHLSNADMAELRFNYALCEKISLRKSIHEADTHIDRVPVLTDSDLILGAAVPGYLSAKGTWLLTRSMARATVIATERPAAFNTCMRGLGWWHEDDFVLLWRSSR